MKKIISLVLVMMITITAVFATYINYEYADKLKEITKTTIIPIDENSARINKPTYKIYCYAGGSPQYIDKLMPYTKNYLLLDVVSAYYELDAFLIPKDPSSVADLDEEYEGFTFTPLKEGKISFRIYLYDQNSNVLYSTDADFYCFLPTKSNLDVNIYSGSPEFGKAFTHTDINARFNPYQDLYGYAVFDENNNIVAYPYSRWRSHFSVIIDERYNNKPGKYTFIGIIYDEAFYYVKKDFEILN